MFFFLILIQRNCSIFKIMIVNVFSNALQNLGSTNSGRQRCSGPIRTNSTTKISRPGRVRCSFRRSCSEPPHVWRVVWFCWDLANLDFDWRVWASKRPSKNHPCFLFYPFTTPPKKNERMFHEKGPFQNEKIVFLHHDFSESTSLYSLLAVFGAEISSPSLSESDKYSNSKPPAPG